MARFLAVYTMQPEDLARFRAMSKEEQDAVDAVGLEQWKAWGENYAGVVVEKGGMVGKNVRVTKNGTSPVTNTICGYVVVEADNIEEAAKIFEQHPHIKTFPGDAIDIMPFVT